jgi:hypothetical protein
MKIGAARLSTSRSPAPLSLMSKAGKAGGTLADSTVTLQMLCNTKSKKIHNDETVYTTNFLN